MAYPTASQITDMTNVSLGQIAQILFSKGFTSQMNRTYRDYDSVLINMKQGSATTEREYRYLLLKALGVNSVKWQQQGVTNVAFPKGDIGTTQEVVAVMKKLQATIELDLNMWKRVRAAQAKYIDNPLVMEIQSKLDVVKREQARALYSDGTGVIGVVGGANISVSGTGILIPLSTVDATVGGGNTNWFNVGEKIAFCDKDGVAHLVASGGGNNLAYAVVTRVDRKNRNVYATCYTSGDVLTTATGVGTVVATDFIYPASVLDSSFVGPDRDTSIDYGTVTPVMAGLESLAANDSRVVFGVTMSGLLAGSRFDHGGGIFDVSAIEESMNETEQNVGAGKYKYDNLIMPYNAFSALIEGKEADRRFNSVEDSARGGRKFIYQYGDQSLDCVKSYFCPFNRIYSLPKPASSEMGESGYALELRGVEFEDVALGNQKEFMKLGSSEYLNVMQSFLEGWAVLIAKQPAAINVIHNFTMV